MSNPRSALHLLAPPPPDQLRDRFPSRECPAGARLFRTHRAAHGPCWFSSSGYGRFDLAAPNGTCYTAETEQLTLLETWAGMRVVPSTELVERYISVIQTTTARNLADLTSNAATQFGVTAEIFTTGNYQRTQLWAAALRAAGYDGIRYWARHDLAHTHGCIALFDTAGEHTGATPHDFTVTTTSPLTDRADLTTALRQDTGIVILPIPPSL